MNGPTFTHLIDHDWGCVVLWASVLLFVQSQVYIVVD